MAELRGEVFYARLMVLEMLYDRGYRVDSADLDLKFADFVARFCGGAEIGPDLRALTFSTTSESDPGQRVLVRFLDECSLVDICSGLNCTDLKLLVLVALPGSGLTYRDEPIFVELFRFKVEVFGVNELQRNLLGDAGLRGRHQVITDDKMVEMLREKHANMRQVTLIPGQPLFYLARYYGLKKGDAVEFKYPKLVSGDNVDISGDNADTTEVDLPDRIVVDLRKLHRELRQWPHILCRRVE